MATINKICNLCKIIDSEYDQEIPQLQTADKPGASQRRATQQSRDSRERQTKQSNPFSLPIKMFAKLEWTQRNAQQNIDSVDAWLVYSISDPFSRRIAN